MDEELATLQKVYDICVDFFVNYSFQLAGAVIILVAGFIVGSWVRRVLLRLQERRDVDVTLRQFIASAARLMVIALFVIIALSKLGISITPLIAAVGGLAVGASFAIQGPVSNYGAGLVIILTRMFKVGDAITVQGCAGVVTEIDLAATRLVAEDGEDIVIPNKHIVGEIHRNSYARRIVEGSVTIDIGADAQAATQLVRSVLTTTDGVAAQPAPVVGIEGFPAGGIVVGYRYWVPAMRYFDLSFAVNDAVYAALRARGIALAPAYAVTPRPGHA